MADRKNYYKLDDIGFIGTQEKISSNRKRADAKKTAEIIRPGKSRKISTMPQRLREKVVQ